MPLTDYFTESQLRRQLPRRLTALGWSPDVVDICWLACSRPGHQLEVHDGTLVLCRPHLEEFESRAGSMSAGDYPWQEKT